MLWLAGLMGLMAVGTVVYVDTPGNEDAEDRLAKPDADEPDTGDILTGTDGSDAITGGKGDDQIGGGAGDDLIDGGAGDDDAHGQSGDDTLDGGAGDDNLHGEDGDDALYGEGGDDTIAGHNDDDKIDGMAGNDSLQGSAGNDTVSGGNGDDAVMGGLGNDVLDGGAGNDSIFGGWGNDTINGVVAKFEAGEMNGADADEADFLNGGGGDDLIIAGRGDIVTAGEGADQITLGEWITQGHEVNILDFEADEDSLLFVWDDTAVDIEPEITLVSDPDNANLMQVRVGDVTMATVGGDTVVDAADITLIPLSTAAQAGLLPI